MRTWLQRVLADPAACRELARERVIEGFLTFVERTMEAKGVSRSELARRLGCKRSNVTQIMRRTRNLTVSTMVDFGLALGFEIRIEFRLLNEES